MPRTAAISPAPNTIITPPSTIRPEKVKCKVTRTPDGYYSVAMYPLGLAVPSNKTIRAFLSKKAQDVTSGAYWGGYIASVMQNIGTAVRTKEWAAAIARAAVFTLTHEADSEVELLAVQGGGYLSLGNCLFRIDAVDHITTGKALPALRRTVLDDATATAAEKIRHATEQATNIISRANAERADAIAQCSRIKAEHERLSADIKCVPPEWTAHHLLMRYGGYLMIFFWAEIQIGWFEWRNGTGTGYNRLEAKAAPTMRLLMGCPLDTHYNPMSIVLASDQGGWLPHITDHACGSFAAAPRTLGNLNDMRQLLRAIESATRGVNLGSLLAYPRDWLPGMFNFVPKKLEPVIERLKKDGFVDYDALSRIKPDSVNEGDTFTVAI